MEYTYKNVVKQNRILKDKEGNTWKYIGLKELHEPPLIFGDVTGDKAEKAKHWVIDKEKDAEKKIRVFSYREKLSFFDKYYGYMEVVNEQGIEGYLRIRKKSPLKMMIPVCMLVLIIMIGVSIWQLYQNDNPLLDETAIAYQMPNGAKNTDENSILLPGYDVLYLNEKTKQVDVALFNPEGNQCYFRFHIALKDSKKEIYQTGLIKPGTAVTSFTVQENLTSGEYPIIIQVDTIDLEDTDKSLNGGIIEAILKVE